MNEGFVFFHRKSINNPVFKKPLIWHYFQYCLLKANHKDIEKIWNMQKIIIKRGSFITGLSQSSEETGLTVRNIRTARKTLLNLKMIEKSTEKSTSKFTYLTVCNYEKYQIGECTSDRVSDKQATSKRQASDKQVTTNNNDNNDNNDNNIKEKRKKKEKLPLPGWLDHSLWNDFLEMRKVIKKPATNRAQKMLLKRLAEFHTSGIDIQQVLEISILNCWQNVYRAKEEKINVNDW